MTVGERGRLRRAAIWEIHRTLDLWSDNALREEIDGWSMAEKCLSAALLTLASGLTSTDAAVEAGARALAGNSADLYEHEIAAQIPTAKAVIESFLRAMAHD